MLNKTDYNVTAQDRLQFAQYELLRENRDLLRDLVDLLSGETITEEIQEKIEASNDNNSIIQELKQQTLFDIETLEPTMKKTAPKPKVGGEKNDKTGNSKKRKTTDK